MIGEGKPRTGRAKIGSYREGRNKKLCIRIADEDIKKLNYICHIYQITKGDFLIDAIRAEYEEVRPDGRSIR